MSDQTDASANENHRAEYANTIVCPNCGKEQDPRQKRRSGMFETGYCGMICAMEAGDE
jgi:predicted RNA-binding Zn-ribbon protein involved in translation (DUF1610 family)